MTDSFKNNFDFEIDVKNDELLPNISAERKFSPMDRMLRRELKSVLGMTIIGLVQLNSKAVEVQIKTETGIIKF